MKENQKNPSTGQRNLQNDPSKKDSPKENKQSNQSTGNSGRENDKGEGTKMPGKETRTPVADDNDGSK